jgi:hypothetical protein
MSSENDGKPSWKVVDHLTYTKIELPDGTHLRVKGANLSDEEIAVAIEQFHQKPGGAYREQPTNDPLDIRTTNAPATTPAEPKKSLRWRDIGNAFWLFAVLRYGTDVPDDWNERELAFVFGGAPIPDAELAARLDISVATLSVWRRRLKKLQLVFSTTGPGKSHSYALGPMDHFWFGGLNVEVPAANEARRMMGRAPRAIQ